MENNNNSKIFLGIVAVAIAAILGIGYVAVSNKSVTKETVREGGGVGSALTYSSALSRAETFTQFSDIIKDIKGASNSKSWDPASVSSSTQSSTTVSVVGAAPGDYTRVSFDSPTSTESWQIQGKVTSADTVTVTLEGVNNGAAVNLTTSTLRVTVSSSTLQSSISASP